MALAMVAATKARILGVVENFGELWELVGSGYSANAKPDRCWVKGFHVSWYNLHRMAAIGRARTTRLTIDMGRDPLVTENGSCALHSKRTCPFGTSRATCVFSALAWSAAIHQHEQS